MYFIHFRFLNSIVYRFSKFVIYAFQPFGCKVNSINRTIYLSIYLQISNLVFYSNFIFSLRGVGTKKGYDSSLSLNNTQLLNLAPFQTYR